MLCWFYDTVGSAAQHCAQPQAQAHSSDRAEASRLRLQYCLRHFWPAREMYWRSSELTTYLHKDSCVARGRISPRTLHTERLFPRRHSLRSDCLSSSCSVVCAVHRGHKFQLRIFMKSLHYPSAGQSAAISLTSVASPLAISAYMEKLSAPPTIKVTVYSDVS